jgi:competence protein ComGC
MKPRSRGMTLVEIALVVFILGVFSLVLRTVVVTVRDNTERATARARLTYIQRQVNLYAIEQGQYPPDLDALVAAGYLPCIPEVAVRTHPASCRVVIGTAPFPAAPVDAGGWYYYPAEGAVHIACTHRDIQGVEVWKW